HGDPIKPVCSIHGTTSMCYYNKLCVFRQLLQISRKTPHVRIIQSRFNLIQKTEWRRFQILDGEQERNGSEGLFSAGKLHHILQFFPRRLGDDPYACFQDILILRKLKSSLSSSEQLLKGFVKFPLNVMKF